jgi:hypothetical protein
MRDVHYFRSPYPERPSQKKRAPEGDEEDDDDGQAVIAIDDDEESDGMETAPPHYPHAPLQRSKSAQPVEDDLPEKHRNTKKQHLAVLTTMLYKCMLEGDYLRAGRAFSILLRVESRGKKHDLRIHGLWNIGAELLLRKNDSLVDEPDDSLSFTQGGFKAARAFYKRLILQYPYKGTVPHLVSQLHFCLAMFGTWIFQVQDHSQSAMKALERGLTAEDVIFEYNLYTAEEDIGSNDDGYAAIKAWELEQAREIRYEIEQLTIKPPHDKDAHLIELSGMVSLWLMDLMKTLGKSSSDISEQKISASTKFKAAREGGAAVWKEAELHAQHIDRDIDIDMDD